MKEKDRKPKESSFVDIIRKFHQECAGADNQTDRSIEPLITMLAQAIRSLNSVMLHHQTPTPFPANSVQLGGLECMINQAAKELDGLAKKFLAITLVRSKDGCEFVQQALNAFENQNQVIIDRLSPKLDAALSALNDVLTDPEVPPPDCSHPVGDWLADEITNLTRGVVDQYIAKSLATFETGRNLMRDALDQSQS